MMFSNDKKKAKALSEQALTVTTFIGEDCEFKGTLNTQGSIRIEGNFEGQINAQGEVYIGANSKVKAEVFGKKVIVAGEVTGSVEAISGLEITSSGRVFGDITGDRLMVDEGAIYKGRVNMDVISSSSGDEAFEYRPKTKRELPIIKKISVSDDLAEQAAAAALSRN